MLGEPMRKFGIWTIVILTALLSSAVTSAFWLIAFNRGPVGTAPAPRQAAAQAGPESAGPRGARGAGGPGAGPRRRAPRAAPEKAELEIGPSGLAIPVAGIKPEAL